MKNTGHRFRYGRKTVGAAAVLVTTAMTEENVKGVLIKSLKDTVNTNIAPIYIGDAQVTTATGFPLAPGESVVLPLAAVDIYAVSGTANQVLAWIVV